MPIPAAAIAYPGTAGIQIVIYIVNGTNISSNSVALTVNPAPPGEFQSVSIGADGNTPNGDSGAPMISDSGRVVTFASQATNLISPGTNLPQVYVRDTCIGAAVSNQFGPTTCTPSTMLVSAEPAGSPSNPIEPNGPSTTPSLAYQESASVTIAPLALEYFDFLSSATNLILPATVYEQAYARDTCYLQGAISGCTPKSVLVSANQAGAEPNGPATDVIAAPEWCNHVFVSSATNVIAGVTTPNEIYLSECGLTSSPGLDISTTNVVSANNSGIAANQGASEPAVDGFAETIAFASTSTNLSSVSNGGFQQIYFRVTCTGAGVTCAPSTTMISVDGAGNPLPGNSQNPSVSSEGRFVSFNTQVPQSGGGNFGTVYRHDTCTAYESTLSTCTPSTLTISIGSAGAAANGSSNSGRHAMSIDGRFVAFDSTATNLVSGGNPAGQVFVRDTCTTGNADTPQPVPPNCVPTTNMVSVNNGVAIGGSQEAISADGHFVVFVTAINGIQQVVLAYTGF